MIKKFNNKKNIAGTFIKNERKNKGVTKVQLCKLLELQGVYINRDELLKIEKNDLMIKDFELVAIAKVLNLDMNKLIKYLK